MAIIKILDTQNINLDCGSMFNSEEARQLYLKMNGEFCFFNGKSLTTDKVASASAWYKIEYNGVQLSFHICTNFLLKLFHDQQSDLVRNRVMGVNNDHEHRISIHAVDDAMDMDLPFKLDHYYGLISEKNAAVLEIVDEIIENFKNRLHSEVNRYFVNLRFYIFKKCQDKIIEKVVEEQVGNGWDSYLACGVDHSASHYLHGFLYPEPHHSLA